MYETSHSLTEIKNNTNYTQKISRNAELDEILKNITQQSTEIFSHNYGIETINQTDVTHEHQNSNKQQLKKQTHKNNPPSTNSEATYTTISTSPIILNQGKNCHDLSQTNEAHDETKKRKKDRLSPIPHNTPKTSRTKQTLEKQDKHPKQKIRETTYETEFLPATLVSPEKTKKH